MRYFTFVFVLFCCQAYSQDNVTVAECYENIKGKWPISFQYEKWLNYDEDSTFNEYLSGEIASAAAMIALPPDDTIMAYEKSARRFEFSSKGDEMIMKEFYQGYTTKHDTFIRKVLMCDANELIFLTESSLKDIPKSLAFGVIHRTRNDRRAIDVNTYLNPKEDDIKNRFTLDPSIRGYFAIVHESVDGNSQTVGKNNISGSGILRTNAPLDIISYVRNQTAFYIDVEGKRERLKVAATTMASNMKAMDDDSAPNEKLYIVSLGINCESKTKLEKYFNQKISGNAEVYYLGTRAEIHAGKALEIFGLQ